MDLFGFKKRRKQRHEDFMACIPHQTDDFLVTAWCDFDMREMEGTEDEYVRAERRAVEDELDKRGYVDEVTGHVYTKKLSEFNYAHAN